MTEQKPSQASEQPAGKSVSEKPISRRDFLKMAGIAGATVGIGGGLASILEACGGKGPTTTTTAKTIEPTTTTLAATTTTAAKETTTTSKESTTTTTAEETTTTEAQTAGVDKAFISTEKTLADVKGGIENGTYIKKPIGTISADVQKLFASKNPGKKILWVGDKNRDGEMNAVVTDKYFHYSFEGHKRCRTTL